MNGNVQKEKALRYNEDKESMALIAPNAILTLGAVYTYGAEKYAPDNWRKGLSHRECISSALRHIFKWLAGETADAESGLHHLAHAAWNCLTVVEYSIIGGGEDDRPTIRNVKSTAIRFISTGSIGTGPIAVNIPDQWDNATPPQTPISKPPEHQTINCWCGEDEHK